MGRTTTIQIDLEVREELRSRGRMGESYNDVIKRLLGATRSAQPERSMARGPSPPNLGRPWIPLQDRR